MKINSFISFLILILFFFFGTLGQFVNAYTIGVSPNKLELNKNEHAQIILFNNNEINANYTIESELLKLKKEGTLTAFEHKKILVKGIKTGDEIVIVNFDFRNLIQAVTIKVSVFDTRKITGLFILGLIVILGLLSYFGIRRKFEVK